MNEIENGNKRRRTRKPNHDQLRSRIPVAALRVVVLGLYLEPATHGLREAVSVFTQFVTQIWRPGSEEANLAQPQHTAGCR